MTRLKCAWEVTAGVIPGTPEPEFSRRWAITSPEFDRLDRDARAEEFGRLRDEAYAYAAGLTDPGRLNWVRVDWIWL